MPDGSGVFCKRAPIADRPVVNDILARAPALFAGIGFQKRTPCTADIFCLAGEVDIHPSSGIGGASTRFIGHSIL